MKAFILCAGFGERLRPLTNYIPKPLVMLGDKTVFERIVEKFTNLKIKDIAINIYHLSYIFERFLIVKNFDCNIRIYKEKNLYGTGGALKNISDFINDYVVVHNGDIVTDFDLLEAFEFHKNSKNDITLCVMERMSDRLLVFDGDMNLVGWINRNKSLYKKKDKANKNYAFSGVYFVSPNIVKYFPKYDTFSLFDFLISCDQISVGGFIIKPFYWFDIGNYEKLKIAKEFFSKGGKNE